MSSLMQSIFGSTQDKPAATEDLFEQSKTLPDRPQNKPAISAIKNKSKKGKRSGYSDPNNKNHEFGDAADGDSEQKITKKKRKKSKLTNSNSDNGADDDNTHKADKETDESNNGINENDDSNVKTEEKDEERTIFVGNLSLSITRKTLAGLFKDCGPIASCRIRSVPVTAVKLPQEYAGNQRLMKKVCANTNQIDKSLTDTVQGYVVFKDLDTVSKALELNNRLVFDDKKVRVDRATPTVDSSRSVFVGNLPYGAKESTLQDHFIKGCLLDGKDVVGVRIVRDKETFQCKGFGYVLFREKNMIPTALKLHESTYMKRPLRVMVCGKRLKGRRGEAPKSQYDPKQENGKVSIGAFRRIIAKQQKDASVTNKRKRGGKKTIKAVKASAGGVSKRAALNKKVEKKVKKLQKRVSKGMGKTKSR